MKELNIEVVLRYEVPYYPSKRHRYQHTQIQEEKLTVNIPIIEKGEERIAFIVKGSRGKEIYYSHNEQLWRKIKWHEKQCGKHGYYPIKELIWYVQHTARTLPYYADNGRVLRNDSEEIRDKAFQMKVLQEYISNYLILDKYVCQPIGEPMYVINTFGLGHNHGGTSLSVTNWYNSNIPNTSYFPANKRKEAIAYGKKVAKGRGDTESARTIGKWYDIKILMPECVTCDPMNEHGEGAPFLNRLNGIINSTESKNEAGLMVMLATASELNK